MKGFSLSNTAIVILILALLVLGAVMYFIFSQAAGGMTQAEANRIFYGKCQEYKSRNCDWSVTYDKDFDKFVDACRFLFGAQRDAFSCLYSMCQDCKELELSDIKCAGMCKICEGHDYASIKFRDCCSRFKSECASGCSICTQLQGNQ